MPEFPGGLTELRKFLASNILYPDEARIKNVSGKVYVRFLIAKNGAVLMYQ
ncbi:MAG: energy transducer TonB [Bacteroidales bacterium]|nr:energy transducer TonB [Bacteroidales bacterium]